MEQVESSYTDDSVREIDEESETWNQLLRSSSDGPGSPNNVIRNEVIRYVKDKIEPQRRLNLIHGSILPTSANLSGSICVHLLRRLQNVVGDTRLRLRPENVEMNLFLKYYLRAINNEIDQLKTPPDEYLSPYSLNRD